MVMMEVGGVAGDIRVQARRLEATQREAAQPPAAKGTDRAKDGDDSSSRWGVNGRAGVEEKSGREWKKWGKVKRWGSRPGAHSGGGRLRKRGVMRRRVGAQLWRRYRGRQIEPPARRLHGHTDQPRAPHSPPMRHLVKHRRVVGCALPVP